jgi:predicted choloylglycine hydrolase
MSDAGLGDLSRFPAGAAAPVSGFGIPLIVRYLLEVADTVGDAIAVLGRVR